MWHVCTLNKVNELDCRTVSGIINYEIWMETIIIINIILIKFSSLASGNDNCQYDDISI